MELREFVKETIIQITDGVREGHKYIKENNYGEGISDNKYSNIEFDVAVGTIEEENKGKGGKISVASMVSVGGDTANTNRIENQSRIQFKLGLHVRTKDK